MPTSTVPGVAYSNPYGSGLSIKRTNLPLNIINQTGFGKTETLGTVTYSGTYPSPYTLTCVATGTGSTARIIAAPATLVLDPTRYYELSVNIVSVSVANPGSCTRDWMSNSTGVASGTASRNWTTPPVAGTRMSIRFQPTTANNVMRFGLGCNAGETVTSGDSIVFNDPQVIEVSSLSGGPTDFSTSYLYNPYYTGGPKSDTDTIGSCLLVLGDSWMNDAADPGRLIGSTYQREIVLGANGGYTLAQISAVLDNLITSGTAVLGRPYAHVPGIALVQGGINDCVAEITAPVMWTRTLGMLTKLYARNIVPIVILPVLATNSTNYTVGRLAVIREYEKLVYASGVDVYRPSDFCLNSDGTANTTYMLDETGAWIHLSTVGGNRMTWELDNLIRSIETSRHYSRKRATW